jgi:hypothetical protein
MSISRYGVDRLCGTDAKLAERGIPSRRLQYNSSRIEEVAKPQRADTSNHHGELPRTRGRRDNVPGLQGEYAISGEHKTRRSDFGCAGTVRFRALV